MSAPLSPAARTLTRTSPLPGTGSGCCSTTSCPSRMVTARIAGSLFPLEHRDALDVVCLREHVHGPYPTQHPPRLHEFRGVRRQRGGVAGDVDDAARRGVDD